MLSALISIGHNSMTNYKTKQETKPFTSLTLFSPGLFPLGVVMGISSDEEHCWSLTMLCTITQKHLGDLYLFLLIKLGSYIRGKCGSPYALNYELLE